MRDSHRGQVYDAQDRLHWIYDNAAQSGNAEAELKGIRLTLPPEARFGSVDSVQAYVDRVTGMPAVVNAFGHRGAVIVRPRKGNRKAHYELNTQTIALPDGRDRWAMRELVVLHELAHHYDRGEGPDHGPGFVTTFAELIGIVMGPETGLALRLMTG